MYCHQYGCTYRRQYLHDHYQVEAVKLSIDLQQLSLPGDVVELDGRARSFAYLPLDWPTVVPKR